MCRVPIGWIDAAPYYQEMMTFVLDDLIYTTVIQYLDDGLVFAAAERGLLDALRAYFTVLRKHNIKLHPGKFVLLLRSQPHLGWQGHQRRRGNAGQSSHEVSRGNAGPRNFGGRHVFCLWDGVVSSSYPIFCRNRSADVRSGCGIQRSRGRKGSTLCKIIQKL